MLLFFSILEVLIGVAEGCSFIAAFREDLPLHSPDLNAFAVRRGPDFTNIRRVDGWHVLHNLLHMTGGVALQPFIDGNSFALFNGEIYNWEALVPGSKSDGDVIMPLYLQYGPRFVQHLDGEFAIVLWDAVKEVLVIASDPFGTKPLHVSMGSTIGIGTYLSSLNAFESLITQGVRRIEPNTVEVWKVGKEEGSQSLIDKLSVFEFDLRQFKTSYSDFFNAWRRSVAKRASTSGLRAPPSFVGLSAGHDSGAIHLALLELGIPHIAATIAGDEDLDLIEARVEMGKAVNEGWETLLTIETIGRETHWIRTKVEDLPYSAPIKLPPSVRHDQATVGLSFLCRVARARGVLVYLSGTGGDEVISDYGFNGTRIFPQSSFGGLFPPSLADIFPWQELFLSTQRAYLNKEEAVAGSHGIEARYPFLDREFVQEFLWLAPELKSRAYKAPLTAYFQEDREGGPYPYVDRKIGFSSVSMPLDPDTYDKTAISMSFGFDRLSVGGGAGDVLLDPEIEDVECGMGGDRFCDPVCVGKPAPFTTTLRLSILGNLVGAAVCSKPEGTDEAGTTLRPLPDPSLVFQDLDDVVWLATDASPFVDRDPGDDLRSWLDPRNRLRKVNLESLGLLPPPPRISAGKVQVPPGVQHSPRGWYKFSRPIPLPSAPGLPPSSDRIRYLGCRREEGNHDLMVQDWSEMQEALSFLPKFTFSSLFEGLFSLPRGRYFSGEDAQDFVLSMETGFENLISSSFLDKSYLESTPPSIEPLALRLSNFFNFHDEPFSSFTFDCPLGLFVARLGAAAWLAPEEPEQSLGLALHLSSAFREIMSAFSVEEIGGAGWGGGLWGALTAVRNRLVRVGDERRQALAASLECESIEKAMDSVFVEVAIQHLRDPEEVCVASSSPLVAAVLLNFALKTGRAAPSCSMRIRKNLLEKTSRDALVGLLLCPEDFTAPLLFLASSTMSETAEGGREEKETENRVSEILCPHGSTLNPWRGGCEKLFSAGGGGGEERSEIEEGEEGEEGEEMEGDSLFARDSFKFCFFITDSREVLPSPPSPSPEEAVTFAFSADFRSLVVAATSEFCRSHKNCKVQASEPPSSLLEGRKVGWAKLEVMRRGMERDADCSFGVSLDSDAWVRTEEDFVDLALHFGLLEAEEEEEEGGEMNTCNVDPVLPGEIGKLMDLCVSHPEMTRIPKSAPSRLKFGKKHFLIAEEYHTEYMSPSSQLASHGIGNFFVVRNSEKGRKILKSWFSVPEVHPSLRAYMEEGAQGLNFCWDSKIRDDLSFSRLIVSAPPVVGTAPGSLVVRHDWFKDARAEEEVRALYLARALARMCREGGGDECVQKANGEVKEILGKRF